ncbi:uncharacterized protein LOC143598765 [Bidens hawaiensis]|uniref:uncharacterized protein LOC143598765 n=1 Tax=Bidens hawaiensis TaxID=980011 RepID=UPI004049D8AA
MCQQFEIVSKETLCNGDCSFYAKSVKDNGHPPNFLRIRGWQIYSKTHGCWQVILSFCIHQIRKIDQLKKSMFYEVTLEKNWERFFQQENEHNNEGNAVSMKVVICSEALSIGETRVEAIWDERNVVDGTVICSEALSIGETRVEAIWDERNVVDGTVICSEALSIDETRVEAIWDERNVVDGTLWFTCLGGDFEREESVGLNVAIVERMRWEEERVGWVGGGEKRIEMAKRKVKFEGIGG